MLGPLQMKITRQTGTELVLEDSTLWIAVVCFLGSLPFCGLALVHRQPRMVGGAILCWLFAVVWLRKTTMIFDAGRQTFSWRRLRYFKHASGSIPLSRISAVNVETSFGGNRGASAYRLALATPQGSFPLCDEYNGGRMRCEQLRDAILEFLTAGPGGAGAVPTTSSANETESSLRALVAEGRRVEAVGLLRRSQGASLSEAMTRVNQIAAAIRPK